MCNPIEKHMESLSKLGTVFNNYITHKEDSYTQIISDAIHRAHLKNGWFTPENSKAALKAWSINLTTQKLHTWLSPYITKAPSQSIKIGIVAAGNIPLVGLHDLICCIVLNHHAFIKLSEKDSVLIQMALNILIEIDAGFKNKITLTDQLRTKELDAIIATGSNNSASYFNYYFQKHPSIIRRNRNSIAVLTGNESIEELKLLADDIFLFFGLGCRSISKLYVPKDFDFENLAKAFQKYHHFAHHNKYINNYSYYKTIYALNKEPFRDFGFCILKESENLICPPSVIHYEYYQTISDIDTKTNTLSKDIQCIVGKGKNHVPLGASQYPESWDYADNVNTIDFLYSISEKHHK